MPNILYYHHNYIFVILAIVFALPSSISSMDARDDKSSSEYLTKLSEQEYLSLLSTIERGEIAIYKDPLMDKLSANKPAATHSPLRTSSLRSLANYTSQVINSFRTSFAYDGEEILYYDPKR